MKNTLSSNFEEPLFNKLDIFGFQYNFLIGEKDKYKSKFGAYLTLFYLFIIVALFFGFGMDLYLRKSPKVSFNSLAGEYTKFQLSNQNFTYAYRIEDNVGLMVNERSVVYLELNYFLFDMVNGVWNRTFYELIENKRCNELPNVKEKEKLYNISLESWYCIDFENFTMGGNFDGNFVYGIQINTKQCKNSTENNLCASREKIKRYFENNTTTSDLFYSDLSLEIMPTMDDYENPLKTSLKNRYDMLNLNVTKRKIQTLKITSIYDDVGWFFPEVKKSSVYSSYDIQNDFTLKETWSQDIVFTQFIYFGKKLDYYYRSYVKIQEVFASIGGFANFFFILINSFFFFVSKVYKNLLLINVISFDEIKNDSKNGSKNEINSVSNMKKEQILDFDNLKKNDYRKVTIRNLELRKKEDNNNTKFKTNTKNQIEYNVSICEYYSFCLFKRKNKKNSKVLNNYKIYENYCNKVMSIFNYFKIQNEFENLKLMILNESEIRCLENLKPKLKEKISQINEEDLDKVFNINDSENSKNKNISPTNHIIFQSGNRPFFNSQKKTKK